jgi:hypothetical protein
MVLPGGREVTTLCLPLSYPLLTCWLAGGYQQVQAAGTGGRIETSRKVVNTSSYWKHFPFLQGQVSGKDGAALLSTT